MCSQLRKSQNFLLTSEPIDSTDFKKNLLAHEAGAFVSFEGLVRNHNEGKKVFALEYETFDALCYTEAEKLIAQTKKKFNIIDLACIHRIGPLEIGNMAVWVGVSAAHRDDAFEACRFVIDTLKKKLPIWKKESYTGQNSGWIHCETPQSS